MVVEGEPGIFPDPIARLLRAIGRRFRRDRADDGAPRPNDDAGGDVSESSPSD